MISFVEQSYSPIALFALPAAVGCVIFLRQAGRWSFLLKWLVASAVSAGLYVIGSTLIDGLSALVGVAFVFALVAQAPVVLAVGGIFAVLGIGRARI